MTFYLRIAIGNDAMIRSEDLSIALERVSQKVDRLPDLFGQIEEKILDSNGNTVGSWALLDNDR